MKREPSLATLKALAEAVDAYAKESRVFEPIPLLEPTPFTLVADALAAYRAEIAPRLRTRAEVDAEIAQRIRDAFLECAPWSEFVEKIESLCAEPTAPEAEPCNPERPPLRGRWRGGHP